MSKKFRLEDLPFAAIPMAMMEHLSVDDISFALDLDRREVYAGIYHTRQVLAKRACLDVESVIGRRLMTEPSLKEFIRGLSAYISASWLTLLTIEEQIERDQLFGYFRAVKAHIRATNQGTNHVQARSHS